MRLTPGHRSRTSRTPAAPADTETVAADEDAPTAPAPVASELDEAPEVGPHVERGAGPEPVADGEAAGSPLTRLVAPVVVPRWIQLVVLPLALLGLWALARAAGTVLLVLMIASVVAIVLNPLVRRFERVLPRGLAILLAYLAAFAVLIGIVTLLAGLVATQIGKFAGNLPQLVRQANRELDQVQTWLNHNGIKVQIEHQGQSALQTLAKTVEKNSTVIVSTTRDLLAQVITIGFDLILILVLSVYLLVYARQIGRLVRRVMPPGDGTPEDDYPLLIQRAVFDYVRGQLTFSFLMGASAAIAMYVLGLVGVFPDGRHYALFFGGFYGLMELIPYVGPIVGALPAVLVALFADPLSAVWVALVFVALQQLEGHVVAPQVFRISLQINPIIIILSLLIGYQIYGIPGALVALPIAAMGRQTVVYLRRHLVLEPWSNAPAPLLGPSVAACGRCGAAARAGQAFCGACGAPLGDTPSAETEAAASGEAR